MNKIELYFSTLIMCIIVFGFLQALNIMSVIIIQIMSIAILIYGVIGASIWFDTTKKKKEDENNG